MKHTPGPWKAKGGSVKAVSHGIWFTVAVVDKKKFTVEGRGNNARLIAAAPEMFRLLLGMRDYFEAREKHGDRTATMHYNDVNAVIRKAKGE